MRQFVDIPFRIVRPMGQPRRPLFPSHASWLPMAVVAFTVCAAVTLRAQGQSPEGFSLDYLDRTVDACTDFYQFACGNWLAGHPLPADRSRYGRLHELADRNATIVRSILEQAAEKVTGRTSNEQKIGDAYTACMDQ